MLSRRAFVLAAGAGVLGSTAAGCGSGQDPSASDPVRPTASPPSGFVHHEPPLNARVVGGSDFSLAIPSTWRDQLVSKSPPRYLYLDNVAGQQGVVGVGVVIEAQPKAGLLEQSSTLETALRARDAVDVNRYALTWPNTAHAVLMTWKEPISGGQGALAVRHQLGLQAAGGLLAVAVASGPESLVDVGEIDSILETFSLR